MRKLFLENIYFFSGCILFFLIGGILLTQIQTSDELFFFNEKRSPSLDVFFTYATKLGEEVLYGLILIFLLFKKVRFAILIPLIGVVVTLVSFCTKWLFGHDRPLVFLEKNGLLDQIDFIEGVYVHTGQNSFPSGHTMSAFALYGFLAFILTRKMSLGIFFFIIALLVGISRIYLVQHFLKDIYLGAIFGIGIASIFYFLQARLEKSKYHWLNQPIWKKKNFA